MLSRCVTASLLLSRIAPYLWGDEFSVACTLRVPMTAIATPMARIAKPAWNALTKKATTDNPATITQVNQTMIDNLPLGPG